MRSPDHDFSRSVVLKLAQRAGFVCSNPSCSRLTSGPDATDPAASLVTGVAAHICAASPKGPRYDEGQTPLQRRSITNGIWLCGSCSMLVDKNGGQDYSVDTLKRWKSDHETTISAYLNGRHRVRLVGPFGDADLARKTLHFLEQRGMLFVPMEHEVPAFVMESTKEIRNYLTSLQAELEPHSPLAAIASSINGACRSFMNHTPPGTETSQVLSSLGALRKTVTLSVVDLASAYGLKPTGPLAELIASMDGLS